MDQSVYKKMHVKPNTPGKYLYAPQEYIEMTIKQDYVNFESEDTPLFIHLFIEFVKEVKPDFVSFSVFTPYPGTAFYCQLGLDQIPYHLFNHHNLSNKYSLISPEKILEVAKFSDDCNNRNRAK